MNKKTILALILSLAFSSLFAWVFIWRLPDFANYLRYDKLFWFGGSFIALFALFFFSREKLLKRISVLFSGSTQEITFKRVLFFLAFSVLFLVVVPLRSDYFDMRFPHTLRIENTSQTDIAVKKIYLSMNEDGTEQNAAATADDIKIQEFQAILSPGQIVEMEQNFFYSPATHPSVNFLCDGETMRVTIDGNSTAWDCAAEDSIPGIPLENKALNRTWLIIFAFNIAALLLSSLILPFLLIPAELLDRKKTRNLKFHSLLLGLVVFAVLVAFGDELTANPVQPPLAGLVDGFGWDWITLNFNSYLTYIFAGVLLLVYYLVKPKSRWLVLLVGSYLFLFSFDPAFPLLLMAVTLLSYFSGRRMGATEDAEARKKAFNRGALGTLGMLVFFKYAPLLWSSASVWAGTDSVWTRIFLPVGMSFYVFTAFSYLKDVQTGKVPAETHFGKFALYLAYFPKLLIGPIERPKTFFAELEKEKVFAEDRFVIGLSRIGLGLFKRLLLSNRLTVIADTVFAQPSTHSMPEVILGVIAFSFQVYIDFSAYCDIAIGLSSLFGIQLTENFQQPYFATSIADFWRRWHISFSTWLRDYVFLPLEFETRRVRSKPMQYVNTLLTFLISGMWHGATINFLVWGGLHGLYQIGEDMLSDVKLGKTKPENSNNAVTTLLKVLTTFGLVSLAWIFFRAENYQAALDFFAPLTNIRTIFQFSADHFSLDVKDFWLTIGLLPLMLLMELIQRKHDLMAEIYAQPMLIRWGIYLLGIFMMIILGFYGVYDVDFVYMQF